jgi:hypothetical protein
MEINKLIGSMNLQNSANSQSTQKKDSGQAELKEATNTDDHASFRRYPLAHIQYINRQINPLQTYSGSVLTEELSTHLDCTCFSCNDFACYLRRTSAGMTTLLPHIC